jgi:hypothetical protein
MQTASLAAKMKVLHPDIFVHPEIHNVSPLDLARWRMFSNKPSLLWKN